MPEAWRDIPRLPQRIFWSRGWSRPTPIRPKADLNREPRRLEQWPGTAAGAELARRLLQLQ